MLEPRPPNALRDLLLGSASLAARLEAASTLFRAGRSGLPLCLYTEAPDTSSSAMGRVPGEEELARHLPGDIG